jgi:hypothetical protein
MPFFEGLAHEARGRHLPLQKRPGIGKKAGLDSGKKHGSQNQDNQQDEVG